MDSLENVRQTIHSMESGIREEEANELLKRLQELGPQVSDNPPAASTLKMMQSVGKYLASKTAQAHPDTLGVLNDLAGKLESLVQKPDSDPGREILEQAMKSFQALKKAIASGSLVTEREADELKAVILSIDWEISDITLTGFHTVTRPLMEKLKSNKIHSSFLKIMQSIVEYVAKNKADSHGDSIGLLRRVFADYERMIRTPDMPAAEKKELIEGNIRIFNEFKREIARTEPLNPAPAPPEEELPPALSHVKNSASAGRPAPLSELSDREISLLEEGEEEVSPALSRKKRPMKFQGMSWESFSPPRNPRQTSFWMPSTWRRFTAPVRNMPWTCSVQSRGRERRKESRSSLLKRMNGRPYRKLNPDWMSFFNQDISEDSMGEEVQPVETGEPDRLSGELESGEKPDTVTAPAIEPEGDAETIVPFTYEDEVFREEEPGDEAGTILDRLRAGLSFPAELTREASHEAVALDISRLADLWQKDPDKSALLEMMAGLARHIHNSGKEDFSEPELENQNQGGETEQKTTEPAPPRPKGIWGRIKAKFS